VRGRADVVVIGGGPMGALAARCAAEAGASTVLLEQQVGNVASSSCAGLVSPRTLPLLGASQQSVLQSIRAVEAFGPNEQRIELRADDTKAFVLDRHRLEQELLGLAKEAGAEIRVGCRAKSVRSGRVEYAAARNDASLDASVIILATGPSSQVARGSGLPGPARLLPSSQATIRVDAEETDRVSVYIGSDIAPGFFAWAVPAEPGILRVGLAVREGISASETLKKLLDARFPEARVTSQVGGQVAIGPVADPARDGILLVGDAAGHVKPLSGGGLYFGGICARVAGRLAAEASISGRTTVSDLAEYGVRCSRAIGRELRFGLALRRLLDSLTDERLCEAMTALDHPDLLAFLAEIGDIDRLRGIPKALLKKRRLWRRLVPFLGLLDRLLVGDDSDSAVVPALADFL